MAKSKTYIMWLCDTCDEGVQENSTTKKWKKNRTCSYCFEGKMNKQKVNFEIIDK